MTTSLIGSPQVLSHFLSTKAFTSAGHAAPRIDATSIALLGAGNGHDLGSFHVSHIHAHRKKLRMETTLSIAQMVNIVTQKLRTPHATSSHSSVVSGRLFK
jgi:hypothetical protein